MSEIRRDYSFYKFVHNCSEIDDFCYVGSTSNVKCRKAQHKHFCNNPDSKDYTMKLYQVMRDNGGFENFKMVIIGTREQLTKTEAHMVEEEYRKSENANLNARRCFLTPADKIEWLKQYNEKHKEEKAAYDKEYYEENKEEKAAYGKKYRKENKEKLMLKMRKWREAKKQAAQNI